MPVIISRSPTQLQNFTWENRREKALENRCSTAGNFAMSPGHSDGSIYGDLLKAKVFVCLFFWLRHYYS